MTKVARWALIGWLIWVAVGLVFFAVGPTWMAAVAWVISTYFAAILGREYGRTEHRRAEQWMAASGLKVCPTCRRPVAARRGANSLSDERQD